MDEGEGARDASFNPEETGRGVPETVQRARLTLPQAQGPVVEPLVVPWQRGFGRRPPTPRKGPLAEEFTVAWQLPAPRLGRPGARNPSGRGGH